MKKPLNYLASKTEKLTNYRFPHQKKLLQLEQLTQTIRSVWQDVLPEELLATLSVIFYDEVQLTISTNSHTLANHLNYNRMLLLNQLIQREPSLQTVIHLKFRVITLDNLSTTLQCNQTVSNVKSRELSELTKQNIAQLAELVTDDIRLRRALHKLINKA